MAKKMNVQRNDGRYMVKVYTGLNDGKKTYKFVYGKTQKEADNKAAELKISLKKGIDVSASSDSFKVWANHWLAYKKSMVKADRYSDVKSKADVWIDAIGNAQITQIKPFQLQSILFTIAAENPKTGMPMAKKP